MSEATGRESELKRKNRTLEFHKCIIAADIFCQTRKYNERELNLMRSPSSQMDSMPFGGGRTLGQKFFRGNFVTGQVNACDDLPVN